MRLTGTQTVYPCNEHEAVEIPLAQLTRDGELDLYPEVAGKGYFDLDYRRGSIVLTATKYVGLIPISDRVAIHVTPKVPIANLLWMVHRTNGQLTALEDVVRSYAFVEGSVDDPETLYVQVFLRALKSIYHRGLVKQYLATENDHTWRGRPSIARSVERFYARGIRYRHTFVVTDHSVDNPANQIIKATAIRLLQHLQLDAGGEGGAIAKEFRKYLEPMSQVDAGPLTPEGIAGQTPAILRSLPPSYEYYRPALWLAFLIARKAGVVMEQVGAAKFESVLVNISDVFEEYVRTICFEAQDRLFKCSVRDGNKYPLLLFERGERFDIKPDIHFHRLAETVLIADAKYKEAPSRPDRYELISHCVATNSRRGLFICPLTPGRSDEAFYGEMVSGLRVDVARINLGAADMRAEEERFARSIAGFVEPAYSS